MNGFGAKPPSTSHYYLRWVSNAIAQVRGRSDQNTGAREIIMGWDIFYETFFIGHITKDIVHKTFFTILTLMAREKECPTLKSNIL